MDTVWLHRAALLMLVGLAWFAFDRFGASMKGKFVAGNVRA